MSGGGSSSSRVIPRVGGLESGSDRGPNGIRSVLTGEELGLVHARFFLPREYVLEMAGPQDRVHRPPEGRIGMYVETLLAGLRFPFHEFVSELLRAYRLVPAQLTPNSWRLITGFLSLCLAHKIPVSVRVFRGCFMLKTNPGGKEWLYFTFRGGKPLFKGIPTSIHGWKERFFFVSSGSRWGFNPEWGVPRLKENNILPDFTGAEKEALEALRSMGGEMHLPDLINEEVLVNVGLSPAPPEGTGQYCGFFSSVFVVLLFHLFRILLVCSARRDCRDGVRQRNSSGALQKEGRRGRGISSAAEIEESQDIIRPCRRKPGLAELEGPRRSSKE